VSLQKSTAILLISGKSSSSIADEFSKALKEFAVEVSDSQEILMSGRVILAIEFQYDPAHLNAIEYELGELARAKALDLATEIL